TLRLWEGKKKAGGFSRFVCAFRARCLPASRKSRCEYDHPLLPTGRNLVRSGSMEERASKLSGKFEAHRGGFQSSRPLWCLARPRGCRSGTGELERGGTLVSREPHLCSTLRSRSPSCSYSTCIGTPQTLPR